MEGRDAAAIPWMQQFTREPVPEQIVWLQDDITHSRSYWLAVDDEEKKAGTRIRAQRDGQRIALETDDVTRVRVLLDDRVANLDDELVVVRIGSGEETELFRGRVQRTLAVLARTLEERGDKGLMFSGEIPVELGGEKE
jgi:hypothetical protein